jgi:hypothetical protein
MRVAPTFAVVAICLLAGCEQLPPAPPLIDGEAQCRHLLPDSPQLFRQCVEDADVANAIREDGDRRWAADAAATLDQPQAPALPLVPVFEPPTLSPPPAAPVADLPGASTAPARAQTWGETPYAPMIPPVMRDQPVTEVNPMIPPAARGMQ